MGRDGKAPNRSKIGEEGMKGSYEGLLGGREGTLPSPAHRHLGRGDRGKALPEREGGRMGFAGDNAQWTEVHQCTGETERGVTGGREGVGGGGGLEEYN